MLVEFWDFCRPNSLRTLPYLKAWHERYAEAGLRVIGVHCPGFEPSRDEQAVREAIARLGIEYPVLIDSELELWQEYENQGWPARYLFDGRGRLFDYHYGEGAYAETEPAIQAVNVAGAGAAALRSSGASRATPSLVANHAAGVTGEPLRHEDGPDVALSPQTADQPGAYSGPYEAGGVWGVFAGRGSVLVNGVELEIPRPGAYPLIAHERHTRAVLELDPSAGVDCLATCFTPGTAA